MAMELVKTKSLNKAHRFVRTLTLLVAGLAAAVFISVPAVHASESRAYVVKWFHYANYSQDSDCPEGINPNAEGLFRRILEERGTPSAEIEKQMEDFPYSMYLAGLGSRGVIDGKPANPYLNPTSTKDPMLHLGQGKTGYGFNLDGKDTEEDFVDPDTGENGVDNQFFRVAGCTNQLRSAPGEVPTFPEIQWDMMRDHTPAWLIEFFDIDSLDNDDDVGVRVVRAKEPIRRNGMGLPQSDMTYTVDPDPRMAKNIARGKIENGVFVSEAPIDFFMVGEAFGQAEYAMREARYRFNLKDERHLTGIVGGYHNWRTIYVSWALGGLTYEVNASFDIPGLYYALRKTADAYPDPETGENTHISTAYWFDAVPAFIQHAAEQTAQAK
ncbi:MAG TPA: hypothetical protein DGZ24_06060 [Rhodospirillaceae bacterium]|nr:hypothetical protein [Candidatus Neomarinimicrobiota bacterium]HCX14864.1 hypothetical protein [Rhodospirillaceae bacterium]